MATPIGVGAVTSLARRFIMPEIVDVVYNSNPFFFRLNKMHRKLIRGGIHIEFPFMYQRFSNGGPYQGYETLNVAPNDTIKNGAWDWKQQYVPVTVDGLTLIKTDSPEAIANIVKVGFAQAEMEMAENLATGIWSNGTSNPIQIDGMQGAIDNGAVTTVYAGLTRASNTWLNSQVDAATATLTTAALQSHFMSTKVGGRSPTLMASRIEQYNRYHNLGMVNQQFQMGPTGSDEVLMQAGFTNLLYNNVPWLEDSHVFDGPNTTNSAIVTMNEDYFYFAVSPRADMYLRDFQQPVDQDAMVSMILWAGNLIISNPARQGKMTNVSS